MKIIEKTYRWSGTLARRGVTRRIILHHAAAVTCSADQIHAWHLANGWSGIGYHFFVRKDGTVYRGRPEDTVGAHAGGSNSDSIGVCFEGSFDKEEMPAVQRRAGTVSYTHLDQQLHGVVGALLRAADALCGGLHLLVEKQRQPPELLRVVLIDRQHLILAAVHRRDDLLHVADAETLLHGQDHHQIGDVYPMILPFHRRGHDLQPHVVVDGGGEMCIRDSTSYLANGTTYYYKVRALGSDGSYGPYSTPVSVTYKAPFGAPLVTGSKDSQGRPALKWDKVTDAAKYEVYRARSKDGTYLSLIHISPRWRTAACCAATAPTSALC